MQLFRELVSKGLYEITCLKLCQSATLQDKFSYRNLPVVNVELRSRIVTTVYCVSDFEGTIFIFSKYSFEFEN